MALWSACMKMIPINEAVTTTDNYYKKLKSTLVKYDVTKVKYVK